MKELAIFDLDNTLLKEQSQAALLGYAFRKGFIGLFFLFLTDEARSHFFIKNMSVS